VTECFAPFSLLRAEECYHGFGSIGDAFKGGEDCLSNLGAKWFAVIVNVGLSMEATVGLMKIQI